MVTSPYKCRVQNRELEKVGRFGIIKMIQKEVSKLNQKTYNDVISGKSDNNINFNDFRNLIVDLGFVLKGQKGSHVSYYHKAINERMIIQTAGSKAKGYQVRQLRNIIKNHNL